MVCSNHYIFIILYFMAYNSAEIEKKWQEKWEKSDLYKAEDFSKKSKKYILIEFPYPSGAGLHVGHVRSYTALDVMARKTRMQGYNVLYPIGWDAFGLPTENYAIKNKIHPRQATEENIAIFKKQLKGLGLSFDWSREINTTDSAYYKWTQWIFLQLFKQGLAYKKKMPINWCVSCRIGLANEEVVDGRCERCGTITEKRDKEQWLLAITKYADRLIDDLDMVDYLEKIKTQQINWIGRSEGAEIEFGLKNIEARIKVFTTRPDTIFGATFMVVCPEHEIIVNLKSQISNFDEVEQYIKQAKNKSDLERTDLAKEKTGVELKGIKAINPLSGEEMPIFVADYVLSTYGTGAIMAVPAHDERDWEFAKKYGLPMVQVVEGGDISAEAFTNIETGTMINSDEFNGLSPKYGAKKIIEKLEKEYIGKKAVQYKLRDWIFSRQHYWGEPIPIIICEKCGYVPVSEKDLPVELPDVKNYEPTETGESPLANMADWVNTVCPKCGGPAKRETDTMPNWAGSSWYFLRYIDSQNSEALADRKKLDYWLPVDLYNGGMEHTTLHLLYSRFWHKFLFDIGIVPAPEPYASRRSHGMVLAGDGKKMSKSLGNVINPDEMVEQFGADSLRLYEMFMGPFSEAISWNTDGLKGVKRFLEKVWGLQEKIVENVEDNNAKQLRHLLHQTVKKVSDDIDNMKFNTAVSQMMILVNKMGEIEKIKKDDYRLLLLILAPLAPHITEELWETMGEKESIFKEAWPQYDEKLIQEETVNIVVQINGKLRDTVVVPFDASQAEVEKLTQGAEKVKNFIGDKLIKKIIFVPNKLINLVIG